MRIHVIQHEKERILSINDHFTALPYLTAEKPASKKVTGMARTRSCEWIGSMHIGTGGMRCRSRTDPPHYWARTSSAEARDEGQDDTTPVRVGDDEHPKREMCDGAEPSMLHVVKEAIISAAPLVWTEKVNGNESCPMVDKGSVESAMSIERDILSMSIESTEAKKSEESNKSERSAKITATVESTGSVISNEDDIVKMSAKSMFSIKSKWPAKSNEEFVASAPVDWLTKENEIDLLPDVLRSDEASLEESILHAHAKSKRSHTSTESEGSAKIMAMVESMGLVMSNEDDVAAAALVQVEMSTKLASEETPKMSLSRKQSQWFKNPSMMENVWNNATAFSIMVKKKSNVLMVNTRKMSPVVKMSAKSMFSIKSKGPAKSNEEVVASAPINWLSKENEIELLPDVLRSVEASLEESIIPAQAKSKRSHESTESEGSAKITVMVESKGLVTSNEDDAASAALVGLAKENEVELLPEVSEGADERIYDELKNMTYQQQIEFYKFYKQQQNLLLRTLAREEQSQMTAESAATMSLVALEKQREQLNPPLQSDSSSHLGEVCRFGLNDEEIEVEIETTSSSSSSSSSLLQSDSSSHLSEDCSCILNQEGIEVILNQEGMEVDCIDCGSGFFSFNVEDVYHLIIGEMLSKESNWKSASGGCSCES